MKLPTLSISAQFAACIILINGCQKDVDPNMGRTSTTLSIARYDMAAASLGTKVFFAGGRSGLIGDTRVYYYNRIDIYDNATNTWSVDSLSKARSALAAAVVGNKILFAGGEFPKCGRNCYSPTASNVVDIYDINTNSWSIQYLSVGRSDLAAATLGNKVFFAGGRVYVSNPPGGDSGYSSEVVDIYDNSTNTWSTARLSESRIGLAAASVGNKVFFAGGEANSSRADLYDNNTASWTLATVTQSEWGIWFTHSIAATIGEKLFFITNGATTVVDIYESDTDSWSVSSPISSMRNCMAMAAAGSKVYIAGGYINHGCWSNSSVVDVFDVNTNSWSQKGLSEARAGCTSVTNGSKVFFAGGTLNGGSRVVDIFDTSR